MVKGSMDADPAELAEALRQIESLLGKLRKVVGTLAERSPQRTLAVRRVRALEIAADLVRRELVTRNEDGSVSQPEG